MTGIELYSTTASSNNSATPNGWPEGQAPSSVNDCARQMMASIRTWYETAEWINWGHTPTYIGATQFSVPTDLTAIYQVGRRVKAYGTTPFTIYGTISASAYVSVTTVTVTWDSGSLNGTLTAVSVGSASVTNPSIYSSAISGLTAAIVAAAPSAPFIDSTAIIKGSADATKLLKIEVDGFTTGTTRVLTPPNYDGTIATLAGTEALTNKTISTSTLVDSSTTFVDDGDATKKLAFQCSGITTATTRTVTIPDKSGTLAMTSDIVSQFNSGTAQNTTSGTAISFTGIASGITRIKIVLAGVSTNGTANLLIQVGAGSTATSGYLSTASTQSGTTTNSTAGFVITASQGASDVVSGIIQLCLQTGTTWVSSGLVKTSTSGIRMSAGDIATLGGTLDRVILTTTNGTDTFDAGVVNILYE